MNIERLLLLLHENLPRTQVALADQYVWFSHVQ